MVAPGEPQTRAADDGDVVGRPRDGDGDVAAASAACTSPPHAPAPPAVDAWIRPATRWLALLVVTGLVGYLCWLILAPFADVLMWALVLAVAFNPVHRRIARRLRRPSLAAALSCALVIVTILVPLALITLAVLRDATALASRLQERKDVLLDRDTSTPVGRMLRRVDRYVDIDRVRSEQYIAEQLSSLGGVLARGTLNILGGMVGAVVEIFFVIFALFYLFRDGEQLRAGLRACLPLERRQAQEVFARTRQVIEANVYGSLVVAAVQGALGCIAFWVLGVPSPLLWGAVMIIVCMIPMAGSFLVWVPVAIYLLATGHPMKAMLLTAWGALVISTVDNILRPKLVGPRTHMHELIVFFAVLGGIEVFGMLGIVTGPAVAAVAMALFDVWARDTPPVAPVTPQAPVAVRRAEPECVAAGPTAPG